MTRPPYTGKVPAQILASSGWEWLSHAAVAFAMPKWVEDYKRASIRFTELNDGATPDIHEFSSTETGIERARELRDKLAGEVRQAWIAFTTIRHILELDLKRRLQFGELIAFGSPDLFGRDSLWIPVEAWLYLAIDPDRKDMVSIRATQSSDLGIDLSVGTPFFGVRVVKPDIGRIQPTKQPTANEVRRLLLGNLQELIRPSIRRQNGPS